MRDPLYACEDRKRSPAFCMIRTHDHLIARLVIYYHCPIKYSNFCSAAVFGRLPEDRSLLLRIFAQSSTIIQRGTLWQCPPISKELIAKILLAVMKQIPGGLSPEYYLDLVLFELGSFGFRLLSLKCSALEHPATVSTYLTWVYGMRIDINL